ncbi:putative SP-containing protein [Vairimorpha necatrix]|uniref:SP-containing protein n=1 Tax=Vairimorpha necatrix TaxID=6039 RepID=A0AAX4JBC8_9MICR
MMVLNIFLIVFLANATENLSNKLLNIVNKMKLNKQYDEFDILKTYEIDYISYNDTNLDIDKIELNNNVTQTEIIISNYEDTIDECIEMLYNNKNVKQGHRILIYDKNQYNFDNYKRLIDNLKEYNLQNKLQKNTIYYETFAEKNSLIYDCIFNDIQDINYLKNNRPYFYYLFYQCNGIYYFFNINIRELEPQIIFKKHLENHFRVKNYDVRLLTYFLNHSDFYDFNEIYGIPQFMKKETLEKNDIDKPELIDSFSLHYEEDVIIYKHQSNTTVFLHTKEIKKNTNDASKKIVISKIQFEDLKRLVLFMDTNRKNVDEINMLYKIIIKNYPIEKIFENIYRNKDTAIYIFVNEFRASSLLMSKDEFNILVSNTNVFDKTIISISGMKKDIEKKVKNFIQFITYENNYSTYMIKIIIILAFEQIINENKIALDIFKTIKNIVNIINENNKKNLYKENIDLVYIFDEILRYKETITQSVQDTWEDIFNEFLAFEVKKEKNN